MFRCLFVVCLVLLPFSQASEKAKMLQFLQQNVIGKSVIMQQSETLENGQLGFKLYRKSTFTNLKETPSGFEFYIINKIKQISRLPERKQEEKTIVLHYQIWERRSSGEFIGIVRILNSSNGYCDAVKIFLNNGTLNIIQSTVSYYDSYVGNGRWIAVSQDSDITIAVKRGVLYKKTHTHIYGFDVEGFRRTELIDEYETLERQLSK